MWLIATIEYEIIMMPWDKLAETFKSPTGIASLQEGFAPGDYLWL
jgi:hypothetical protein